MLRKSKVKHTAACFFIIFSLLFYSGIFTHLFENHFHKGFHYPYDGDIEDFVQQLRLNITPAVAPINSYYFQFHKDCINKCQNVASLRLVYLIKSAPDHFHRRMAIRNSWGFERRFSDVQIRTVFLIGEKANLLVELEEESQMFNDLVYANFTDNYYNNTLKTMMGFTWAVKYCASAQFYAFADDDYFISTKNMLRFLSDPINYPQYWRKFYKRGLNEFHSHSDFRFYGGLVSRVPPQRHRWSPWYLSLKEYSYNMLPPFVNAGAYVLSREALIDMYYASFYTQHFKFDDVYVGILANKCKIELFNCDEFHSEKLNYRPEAFQYAVASHGYGNPQELLNTWTLVRSLGYA